MIAIEIEDRKNFMNQLFLGKAFDGFYLCEATFVTFCSFHIDGGMKKEYYAKEELENTPLGTQPLAYWRQARPFCLELIRGKRTPLEFKIIFRLSGANTEKLLRQSGLSLAAADVRGLFLNLHYKDGRLTCTSGTALSIFTMDRSLDHIWDELLKKFLSGPDPGVFPA